MIVWVYNTPNGSIFHLIYDVCVGILSLPCLDVCTMALISANKIHVRGVFFLFPRCYVVTVHIISISKHNYQHKIIYSNQCTAYGWCGAKGNRAWGTSVFHASILYFLTSLGQTRTPKKLIVIAQVSHDLYFLYLQYFCVICGGKHDSQQKGQDGVHGQTVRVKVHVLKIWKKILAVSMQLLVNILK